MIGDSLHIEMIKRCHEIIKFLCKYDYFHLNLIDDLWNAIIGQHETTVRAGFTMIIEISRFLNSEGLNRIYMKIKGVLEFN